MPTGSGDAVVSADEPPQRARAERVEVLDRLGVGRHEPDRQPVRPGSDADLGEVIAGRAPFPDPPQLGVDEQRRERARIGADPLQRLPLRRGGRAHPAPDLAQVAQVVPAHAVQLDLPLATAAAHLADHHAAHAQGHRAAAHVEDRVRVPADEHGSHADDHRDHRHVHQRLPEVVGHGLRDLRRGLEQDLAAGQLRRVMPLGATDDDGAHGRCLSQVPSGHGRAARLDRLVRAGRVIILRPHFRLIGRCVEGRSSRNTRARGRSRDIVPIGHASR